MEEKYLPIGTVCLLAGGEKEIMIIGYKVKTQNMVFDYIGVSYPEGLMTLDQKLVFNHSNISKIIYDGYKNEDYERYNKRILDNVNVSNVISEGIECL